MYKNFKFSGISEQLNKAKITLQQIVDSKMRNLLSYKTHKKELTNQVIQQSDMAIR